MKKIIAYVCTFIILVSSLFLNNLTVYASGSLSGFNDWSKSDKFDFFSEHIVSILAQCVGVIFSPASLDYATLMSMFEDISADKIVADNSADYQEYITKRLRLDENNNLVIDSDLSNALYETSLQYIEDNTGWYNVPTMTANDLQATWFADKTVYEHLKSSINSLSGNEVLIVYQASIDSDGNAWYDGIVYDDTYYFVYDSSNSKKLANPALYYNVLEHYLFACTPYDENWVSQSGKYYNRIFNNGNVEQSSTAIAYGNAPCRFFYIDYNTGLPSYFQQAYTTDGRVIRLYKTVDDMKTYSVGQRPYYVTDKFVNYDSSIDNSTTITQTEIDNSITYGDVYNYIINNYDNPDGLTEEELRAILEEYLSQIGGGSGSGSGGGSGGSDDGGSSGGGLGSFLEGLGSIGDAILSILGKLLEYIGKALELLTGTVTKVLDLIPSNVTNLLLGLFPFIPQEWVTAIELSLVLGVVLAVVGAFKK